MAMQIPPFCRTQGDGMEKVENCSSSGETVILQPQDLEKCNISNSEIKKISYSKTPVENLSAAIKLTPQCINTKKKNVLANLKNKEPKFVPYEPYKAAVRPIVPPTQKNVRHKFKKKVKDDPDILKANNNATIEVVNEKHKNEVEAKVSETDWHHKLKALQSEISNLKEENKELENQLKFQVQVNGELKNLLVASIGEDMENKVHILTEDKLHLAQALLKSAESLTTHQEQTEWLAGQCEVWRSKFLASSVMVEELARWKASLCQKVNEAHEILKKFVEERKQFRDCVINTNSNLCLLRDNFDLHSTKTNLTSYNLMDILAENSRLSDVLLQQLLGSKKISSSQIFDSNNWENTPAEKLAENALTNPNFVQLIGEPDAACNAVVGAAVTLSGQLYLQSHPPKIKCCSNCSGEIKLV